MLSSEQKPWFVKKEIMNEKLITNFPMVVGCYDVITMSNKNK